MVKQCEMKKQKFLWTLIVFFFTVQPLPRGEHVLNFSDAEEMINDAELLDLHDEALERELALADRFVMLGKYYYFLIKDRP